MELTNFNIQHMPGDSSKQPIGSRLHVQPGISLPLATSYFYFTPQLQFAATEYNVHYVAIMLQKSSTAHCDF